MVWPTALRQMRMQVIGGDAAITFRGRFSSENVELLQRVGCTVLLSEGDLPEELKKLPVVGEFGSFTLRSLPRLPWAWVVGAGSVETLEWTDRTIRLRVRGAAPDSKVVLGLGEYDAWRTTTCDVTGLRRSTKRP